MIVASFYCPRGGPGDTGFEAMLELLDASCRRFDIQHFCITDRSWLEARGVQTYVPAATPRNLMHAILYGQAEFMRWASEKGEDVILVGADCLIMRDPREVFAAERFHLGLTTRPDTGNSSINTGAIYVRRHHLRLVATLWDEALSRCGEVWGDDQHSLERIFRPLTTEYGLHLRRGLAVRFFDMKRYNFSPNDLDHRADAYVVHFKGRRKKFMRGYWERYSASKKG
jgi:hypothetical protein